MRTVIIVQARMTSTRLPGKVLKTVMGKPLLEYQLERLLRVKNAQEIVIATTRNDTDTPIVKLCNKLSVKHYRGSEHDVLERYYEAAKENKADIIVRITSDCPLIDPDVVDKTINFFLTGQPKYEYVSNSLIRTYPRGMDTEVFKYSALNKAFCEARNQTDREHVTSYMWRNPHLFKLGNMSYSVDASHHRWTVDTLEDFKLINKMLTYLYNDNPFFTLEDCLYFLGKYPELLTINSHIEQKTYGN